MIDYVWEASFVLHGAKCAKPFSMAGWSVRGLTPSNKKDRVKFVREIREKDYHEYWEEYEIIDKEIHGLLDAMSAGLFFSLEHVYFPAVTDVNLVIKNTADLVHTHQRIPSRGGIHFTYALVIDDNNFQAVLTNLSKINSSPNKDLVRHCLSIYRRALTYEDLFDKFFALWRAFNALYNHFSSKKHEFERIVNTLQTLGKSDLGLLVQTYSSVSRDSELAFTLAAHSFSIFDYLANANLIDKGGNNYSKELRTSLSSKVQSDIVKNTVLCLYVLRCNYAHGSDSQIVQSENLFRVGSVFISALLSCLLKKLV